MEDQIEALRTGKLDFDCSDLCLTQNTETNPRMFRGPGYIRQDPEGGLCFKIYPAETQNYDHYRSVENFGLPGTLVSEDQFYSLKAMDASGKVWTCNRIIPDLAVNYRGPEPVTIVSGDLYAITCVEPFTHRKKPYIAVHFFGDYEIPCNSSTVMETTIAEKSVSRSSHLNLAKFESCGCSFLLSTKPGQLIVEVVADVMQDNLDQRIVESLRFLLAKPLQMRVMLRQDGQKRTLWLASPQPVATGTRLKPPIHRLAGPAAHTWSWRLFDCYFKFVHSRQEETCFAPVESGRSLRSG